MRSTKLRFKILGQGEFFEFNRYLLPGEHEKDSEIDLVGENNEE